jgi:RES domain-containing protein
VIRSLWRISDHADLSGNGGFNASGRWHTIGKPIVYAAESPAGALTELLVHMDPQFADEEFQLLEIEIPSGIAMKSAEHLQPDWRDHVDVTRKIGDEWLAGMKTALLRVPSAIVPDTFNILINPLHGDAKTIRIVAKKKLRLDQRLK